jgi:hypothetical protein
MQPRYRFDFDVYKPVAPRPYGGDRPIGLFLASPFIVAAIVGLLIWWR